MGKLNYPQQQQPDIAPDKLALMVSNMTELQKLPAVKTDAEVAERLDFFFRWCAEKQQRPTVSLMCLCLGVSRNCIWKWQQSGNAKGVMIDRAKQLLEALTENWLLTGKTNPVSGIFILKSQFGFKDTLTIETSNQMRSQADLTPEQIMAQLEKDIPIDEDYTSDVIDDPIR